MKRLAIQSNFFRGTQRIYKNGFQNSETPVQKKEHRPRLFNRRGFTLIELMVVMAIFSFIIGAILNTYIYQQHMSVVQAQVSDAQQNARIAMDFLSKEIRMAGFGAPGTAVNGFSNFITPANNDTDTGNTVMDGTDQITVVTGYRQISTLSAAGTMGDTTISLAGNGNQFNTGTKQYVCIDAITSDDNYTVSAASSSQLTLNTSLTRDYIQGAPVFLVKAITYRINTNRFLTRDENTGGGPQPIAPNIDDLQLAYQVEDGTWSYAPASPEDIRAVRINILARTPRQDADWRRAGAGRRPAIEDHAAAGTADGFRRRLLTSVVDERNMGL